MSKVITNPYHLSVITNIVNHEHFKNAPVLYIVKRVKQMFPEYRDESIQEDLLNEIDNIFIEAGK